MSKCIVFTGGGSAGHVTVNLSLIPIFRENGWIIHYIGSKNGIERQLISKLTYVNYHGIPSGKLRRYFDFHNFTDVFKVLAGCAESLVLLKKIKPDIIFSKGGYVSFPVVYAGSKRRIPVIAHESDYTPGLANRLAARFSDAICLTFKDTQKYIKSGIRTIFTGPIVRPDIFKGSREAGLQYCGFTSEKPVVLVVGGSLGAERINRAVLMELDSLLQRFQIIHICGKNNADKSIKRKGYIQYEYVDEKYADLLTAADLVISRAGSNAIFEFKALRKPMLLIPLAAQSSRGDQIENAERFKAAGYAHILRDSDCMGNLTKETQYVYNNRAEYISAMTQTGSEKDGLRRLYGIIEQKASERSTT